MNIYKIDDFLNKDNGIYIFLEEHGVYTAQHTHDFIELVYVLSGESTHIVDGAIYTLKRGDMLFINYGSSHAFECDDKYGYINICFSPETVESSLITEENAFSLLCLTSFNEMRGDASSGKTHFSVQEREELEALLFAMLREGEQKDSSKKAMLESYLNIIITKMLRKTRVGLLEEDLDGIWRELSDYIDENLTSELTLGVLAKKCFYNPSYFSRVFKEKFGVPPAEHIRKRRLDYATKLLLQTDMTVEEISNSAGFSDRSSFYKAFTRYKGSLPSEYRGAHSKSKKTGKSE
jgi:AraC-like DNA-binding protein